ncbi:MAG: hypothetical protein HZC17_10000, partial [Candidatus Omnitrophica bacterium]|nr:hypothetical protein [Candidatus Omnitrophota bacterium]
MIIRLLCLILVLSSVPVYAGEPACENATISNPRIFNEDPLTARQEANAAALGKMDDNPGQHQQSIRREILADLILRKKGKVAEYYHSIYGKVTSHTPKRVGVRPVLAFTKNFLEEAKDPSRWLAGKTPEEIAEAEKYARMTTLELEEEFAKYYRFSTYTLRTLNWEDFRHDTIGNFMHGAFRAKPILADPTEDSATRAIFEERLTAAAIFREWVYRHWDESPRQPSWHYWDSELARASAKSMGVSSQVEGSTVAETYASIYQKAMDHVSRERFRERVPMWTMAIHFLEEAKDPSQWKLGLSEEREECIRYSKLTTEQLEKQLLKLHKFNNYKPAQINWHWFKGDAFYELIYVHFLLIESARKNHRAYKHADWYVNGEKIFHLYREWVYRHWDTNPKDESWTLFQNSNGGSTQASSLGHQTAALNDHQQALVFQINGTGNNDILNRTAEIVRANPEKTIIFVVDSHAAYAPIRAALKARGVGAKQLDSFQVNPLRTTADANRFANYVEGLQAKFSGNNDIAV